MVLGLTLVEEKQNAPQDVFDNPDKYVLSKYILRLNMNQQVIS